MSNKTPNELIELIKELAKQKFTYKEIGDKLGKTRQSIACICYKNKITNRGVGLKGHPLYDVHLAILSRCFNPKNKGYKTYGGRGITVCKGFQDREYFINWGIENGWQKGLQCDRKNNNGNYSCGQCNQCKENNWQLNCRFVTPKENSNNSRRNTILTVFGESKSLKLWSEDPRCKCRYRNIADRLSRGWDKELAITTPCSSSNRYKQIKVIIK